MARSCLTEGLRQAAQSQAAVAGARAEAREQRCAEAVDPAGPEVGLELRAILAQEPGSASWERSSFFGVSPPTRSDNGLVRDRVFGHCIPITKKPLALGQQQPRSVGTA